LLNDRPEQAMRVFTVFGTRPEAIKMAPVVLAARGAGLETVVCVTAQHREMLDQVLEIFSISPDHDLDIMQQDQSPLAVAARVFDALTPIVAQIQPDWLLVQGDTTTALAAALVAYHERIRVGHVEAGLRTHDKRRPFPEEMNRRLISPIADLNFAPTTRAMENLSAEGVPDSCIVLTGNTVVDALELILERRVRFTDPRLTSISGRILLVTAHRRENFGPRLEQICQAVLELVSNHSDLVVVFPVHRNPAVRSAVQQHLGNQSRVILTDPLPYGEFVHLMKRAALILSDSGGVQEEAPTVGTRLLVLRDVTERPEALDSGWASLVGASKKEIVARATAWLVAGKSDAAPPGANPFGDGHAAQRIVQALLDSSSGNRV
jgi:UDP-N-acetylglucosamine 2-epimerase (non-hydrolysing)